jgi:hypothetical protein
MEILVPLSFFALVFGAWYIYFTTRNKERLALIEKGADPQLFKTKGYSFKETTLKMGLFFVGIGLGVFGGYLLSQIGMDEIPAYFSMIFLFGGIALAISYWVQKKHEEK